MMKASLFKEFSNREEIVLIQAGKTVAENFPGVDFTNAIVLVNGKEAAPGQVVLEGDTVMIRTLPGVAATVTVLAIAFTAAVIAGGAYIYKMRKEMDAMEEEVEKMKKASGSDNIDNRPFLRGASNTQATDKLLPYFCGRNFFTPYLLTPSYYRIAGTDGTDQYTYMVFAVGFGPLVYDKISVDDIMIKNFAAVGLAANPQQGRYDIDAGNVFVEDGMIEITQDGTPLSTLPELNYRHASTSSNEQIPKRHEINEGTKEELLMTLDSRAMDIDVVITFPSGLYRFNDDYDKKSTSITVTPQYSLDGGKSWNSFTFNQNGTLSNTFTRNESKKEIRFNAHKDFSWNDIRTLKNNGQEAVQLRLYNEGETDEDGKVKNDCYCLYYQSLCYDPAKSNAEAGLVPCKIVEDRERAFVSILALKVKSTPSNEDKMSKVNVIAEGTARTWDGVQWSTGKTRTRNPAAIALEILTSPVHAPSRLDDDEIDLESFGAFYEHCNEEGYCYDSTITQAAKKSATLKSIADACDAGTYRDMYGRVSVALDTVKENAVAVYNAQNVKSVENKRTFDRQRDGIRITYTTSAGDLFAQETYLVMRQENGEEIPLTSESVIEDIKLSGVTTHSHVVKYARRMMAKEVLRPKTTTIVVGNEGLYLAPFCKILLQDDSLKTGLDSGVIRQIIAADDRIAGFILDHPVIFEAGKSYGLVINCWQPSGEPRIRNVKIRGEGKTAEVQVSDIIMLSESAIPESGNVWSFGELDGNSFRRVTTEYLITGIKMQEGGYSLDLVNYNEAIFDDGPIPEYVSNLTQMLMCHKVTQKATDSRHNSVKIDV